MFSAVHVQRLKKLYSIGSESSSPISFEHSFPSGRNTTPAEVVQQARLAEQLSNAVSGGGILTNPLHQATPHTTNPMANPFGLFQNLKNLNANIQRIIAAKSSLGLSPGVNPESNGATVTEVP